MIRVVYIIHKSICETKDHNKAGPTVVTMYGAMCVRADGAAIDIMHEMVSLHYLFPEYDWEVGSPMELGINVQGSMLLIRACILIRAV